MAENASIWPNNVKMPILELHRVFNTRRANVRMAPTKLA
ncbi:hypothetical protein PALB_35800 [Pseudoalteromonas luteoviolacea B = ATCC 29581]|nr:hypothetical protein PALB_35800 [Pseudoalteromonas luteoviolacea B = ATCC 29581]